MSQRTGLPQFEVELLRAINRATHGSGTVLTSELLAAVERDGVVGPRAAQVLLVDLLAPWRRHLPLVQGVGNWGSHHGDPPADPEYTEVGLTPYGELALAAEDGSVGPVPLGLIDGSWYRGGRQPPYAPRAMLVALFSGDAAGLIPRPPTGGTVTGDLAGLAAGRPVRLTISATVVFEAGEHKPVRAFEPPAGIEGAWFAYAGNRHDAGGDHVLVTEIPYGVPVDEVVDQLTRRMHAERLDRPPGPGSDARPRPDAGPPAPIMDICDHSAVGHGITIVTRLRGDAQAETARAWVLSTRSLRQVVDALLPAPLQTLVTEWSGVDRSGLDALAQLVD